MAKQTKVEITGGLWRWFEDYLSNKQHRVVIHGQTSEWGDILEGVPLVFILGSVVFLAYT